MDVGEKLICEADGFQCEVEVKTVVDGMRKDGNVCFASSISVLTRINIVRAILNTH